LLHLWSPLHTRLSTTANPEATPKKRTITEKKRKNNWDSHGAIRGVCGIRIGLLCGLGLATHCAGRFFFPELRKDLALT
jgi:hypothetical protein